MTPTKDFPPSHLLDKNPETAQIQGPMTRSRTKQSVDTLQQMVAGILSKAQVEKDKSPNGEGRRPKWKRMKLQVEKDEGPSGEGRRPKWRRAKDLSGEG